MLDLNEMTTKAGYPFRIYEDYRNDDKEERVLYPIHGAILLNNPHRIWHAVTWTRVGKANIGAGNFDLVPKKQKVWLNIYKGPYEPALHSSMENAREYAQRMVNTGEYIYEGTLAVEIDPDKLFKLTVRPLEGDK